MRFSVLGSGSSGNVSYVETKETKILIDAGFSCREIEKRLKLLGLKAREIDAVVVTHEHIDHVRGVGIFARRYEVPVLINRATLARCSKTIGNIPVPLFFNTGESLIFKDAHLHFITKCHDAADPVALTVSSDGCKLGVITDLGRPTSLILDSIQGCQGLILEFNHDVEMLDSGPYPIDLKRRIRGPDGHLSNDQAAEILSETIGEDLSVLVLAHLSETNNTKELAFQEARRVIQGYGKGATTVVVSSQRYPMPMTSLGIGEHG